MNGLTTNVTGNYHANPAPDPFLTMGQLDDLVGDPSSDYRNVLANVDYLLKAFLLDPTDPSFARSKDQAIYRKMRKHYMISAALNRRWRPVAGAPWDIVAQDDETRELAQMVKDMILRIPRFSQVRHDILEAEFTGVSFCQLIWPWANAPDPDTDDWRKIDVPIGERVPANILFRDKDHFEWDSDGTLYLRQDLYSGTREKIHRDSVVVHTFGRPDESNSTMIYNYRWGRGIADELYWPFFWSNMTLKRLMVILDRSGLVPVVTGQQGATNADLQSAFTVGQYFNARGALKQASNVSIEMRDITGQCYQTFMSFLSYLDDAVAKVILGAPLGINAPQGNASRAMASVHLDPYSDILNESAAALDETLTEQLVKPLIRYNTPFPVDRSDFACPKFVSSPRHPEGKSEVASRVLQFFQAGIPMSKRAVRERFNLPEPDPDDPNDSWESPQMSNGFGGFGGLEQPSMGGGEMQAPAERQMPQGPDYKEENQLRFAEEARSQLREVDRIESRGFDEADAVLEKLLNRLGKKKSPSWTTRRTI